MDIRQHLSLKDFSTMHLGGTVTYVTDINDRSEIGEAVRWAEERGLQIIMIGSGSNIVWRDEGFNGLLLVNKIMGYEEQQEDEENYYVTVGAGENWDSVVERTVAAGATGIEALSLIPGTTGATPVQNVGAYGQDVSKTLASIEAYDKHTKQLVNIQNVDCGFGYRTSRFKTHDRGRFFITSVTFHLLKRNPQPPFYASLQQYMDEHNLHEYTPASIREAVIAIRQAKLPDISLVSNNGSFFANPIVDQARLIQLEADFGMVPHWPTDDGQIKIPAAWLLENAGFKDMHDVETGMATWPTQPLVLVNEHAQNTSQLLQFKQKIVDTVHEKFGIVLDQEPELLP